MELVEGHALEELIPAGGLSLRRFLEMALPLADALTAAHQRNIAHRDLKPANVMVTTDGRVKVLDFGLASIAPPPGTPASDLQQDFGGSDTPTIASPRVTTPGSIIGTMPYMSPEQVEGKSLDHRTDLFSLGVMFHEMLTGVRPFAGDTSAQLTSSILRDEPPRPSDRRPDVPDALSHLVQRCLEKRPDDRVQTARDVYNELRHLQKQLESGQRDSPKAGVNTAAHAPSSEHARSNTEAFIVTVLQFTSPPAGGDASDLADGLTQGIVVGLSRFNYLRVVKRNGPADSVAAGYVLQGSVRTAGNVIRVVTQLTEAATGSSLWADSYDRRVGAESLFDLQDEIAEKIVVTVADINALVRTMTAVVRQKSATTLSPYEAVLRRLAYESLKSPEEHAQVREALEEAVRRAPGYADAWASLAFMYAEEYAQSFNTRPEPLERARTAARRALEIDSSNHLAYMALARTEYFSRDRSAFRAAADRAMALNPLDTDSLAFIGTVTAYSGDWATGVALNERAMALNPHHPGTYRIAAVVDHYRRREYAQALAILDRANLPSYPHAVMTRAAIYAQLGHLKEAHAVWREVATRWPEYAAHVEEEMHKWLTPDVVVHLLEGVEKARP
jgi:non-specific serine/threonine protein kinase